MKLRGLVRYGTSLKYEFEKQDSSLTSYGKFNERVGIIHLMKFNKRIDGKDDHIY